MTASDEAGQCVSVHLEDQPPESGNEQRRHHGYDDAVGFIPKSNGGGSSEYDAVQDAKIEINRQNIATNIGDDNIRQRQINTNTEKIETIENKIDMSLDGTTLVFGGNSENNG